MKVKITSPVGGYDVDQEPDVDPEIGEWYVQNGYATRVGDDSFDGTTATSTEAKFDPTLAENREDPNEGATPGVDYATVTPDPHDPSTSSAEQDRSGLASGVMARDEGSESGKEGSGEAPASEQQEQTPAQ